MGLRYSNAEVCKWCQQSKRFSTWSWSERGQKAVRCILDCVPKMELLENVSFGSEPDASELQTAHLPSNRL
jgi:hypothetical protein